MFRKEVKPSYLVLIFSLINLVLYHYAFYKFVLNNIEVQSFNGILLLASITVLALLFNAVFYYLLLYLLRFAGKVIMALLFIVNAIAVYFVNTYGVIIDKSMIGNVLNTNNDEASSFFSITFVVYLIIIGIIPAILLFKVKVAKVKFKRFLVHVSLTLIFLLLLIYANAANWLWIDKNSKQLGALVMPWSYVVNTSRYYSSENKKNKIEILLPDISIKDNAKSVVVLVIGESARSANFSLYGYDKDTNPLLSKTDNLYAYKAESSATYTTAGVKAILDHKETNKLYEILPNYLYRNGIDVFWRTTNWGEPTVNIANYQTKQYLEELCQGTQCEYDEVLLYGLQDLVLESEKDKILIILHTSTSHGPTYFKKYPDEFNQFTPVCRNVELSKCTNEELINAYDNTILYTDYILANLIEELKELKDYNTSMIFISDHGESLGENNLYMHGIPISIAPAEQYEIPFIVWTSNDSIKFKNDDMLSQYSVFHSVLDFLAIESPVYNENMSILKK